MFFEWEMYPYFSLNTLVIGTEDGHVHLYAYAIFPVAKLDLNQHGTGRVSDILFFINFASIVINEHKACSSVNLQSGKVLSAYLSGDLQLLSLVVSCTKEDGMSQEVHLISVIYDLIYNFMLNSS